jgi:hypothetical protein
MCCSKVIIISAIGQFCLFYFDIQAQTQTKPTIDSTYMLKAGGQTVRIEGSSFIIPNISAPDQLAEGVPGTVPDFVSDKFVRLLGVSSAGVRPKYVYSVPFRIRQQQVYFISNLDLTFTDTPIPVPELITISAPQRTMTWIGQTVPLMVISKQLGGGTLDVTFSSRWTTYQTSNVETVDVDADGLCTAVGPGTAFITATNDGLSAVLQMDVTIGDPLTKVTGMVVGPDGAPAAGVSVTVSVASGGGCDHSDR